jgi:hypothetical protein
MHTTPTTIDAYCSFVPSDRGNYIWLYVDETNTNYAFCINKKQAMALVVELQNTIAKLEEHENEKANNS